jgi:hypothetical protein
MLAPPMCVCEHAVGIVVGRQPALVVAVILETLLAVLRLTGTAMVVAAAKTGADTQRNIVGARRTTPVRLIAPKKHSKGTRK